MARHNGPPLSFDFPRDWEDLSEVRYEAPVRRGPSGDARPGRAVMVCARMGAEDDLRAHVERALAALAKSEGFLAREVSDARVDEHPATLVRYATIEAGLPFEHRAFFVQLRDLRVARLTLSAPRTELAQLDPLFDRMLSTVRVGAL